MVKKRPSNRDRERWRRNKRAARAKQRPAPRPITAELQNFIFTERDKRRETSSLPYQAFRHPFFFKEGAWEQALRFAADVWAAKTILAWQYPRRDPSPTAIANQLLDWGYDHGYTSGSLRVMIYKALKRIDQAEAFPYKWMVEGDVWAPIDLSPWERSVAESTDNN